jgi:hypothetical protein
MKILHLSHEKLPDWRVEKAALTGCKYGHTVYFAGLDSPNYSSNVFKKIIKLDWNSKARFGIPYYYHLVKKQVKRVLDEIRPDVIHAHNIFAGKMASDFDYPVVYDDHEYWSDHIRLLLNNNTSKNLNLKNLKLQLRNIIIVKKWTQWEKELLNNYHVITVSNQIITEFKKCTSNKNIYYVPNYPTKTEVEHIDSPIFHDRISSLYSGSDGNHIEKQPHRNIDGLIDLFNFNQVGTLSVLGWAANSSQNVNFKGYLNRIEMYKEMTNHSIGLLPWKQHPSHSYVNPNKVYEYAHAGLLVICTSDFLEIQNNLQGNFILFNNYDDLVSTLKECMINVDEINKKRQHIFDFAKENLFWEKNENYIINAYSNS